MRKKMRIGVLGGSFDPVHVGHLSIAQGAAEALGLDEVLLVPAGEPPHKTARKLADAADRLEMTRLAARGLARLAVSDLEVRRAGTSYTIDTLRQIREEFGPEHEYYFIIGADTVADLPTWHRAAELLAEAKFAIAARPGFEADFGPVKRELGAKAAARLRRGVIEIEPCDVSSTEIRKLAASGEAIDRLVRADVAEYIRKQGLYR